MNALKSRVAAPPPLVSMTPNVQGEHLDPDLYQHLLRALALLCECAPYVDEEDHLEQIDALLADACARYPLQWAGSGPHREIAPREPE